MYRNHDTTFYTILCSNAWPPLQHLVVEGLMKSGEKHAEILGRNLVKKWVKSNYIAYIQTNGTMFEKYDAQKVRESINFLSPCFYFCFHASKNCKFYF